MNVLLIIASIILLVYIITLLPICIEFFLFNKEIVDFENINEKLISVIIPVRNESDNILHCLQSLINQSYSKANYEVLIINDNSTDTTVDIVNGIIENNPDVQIKLFSLVNTETKKKALELGIKNCNYDIIATTDGDCMVPVNWLKNINLQFESNTQMLIGPVIFNNKKGFLNRFQTLDMLAIQGVEFGMIKFSKAVLNNAANLAYRKDAFYKVEGYDKHPTPSGDDIFLLEKFRKHNLKVKAYLSQDFIVETKSENNWTSLINQRLRWSSKTKFYKNPSLIFLGLLILIINISLIFIYIGLPLVENYRIEMLFFLSCKWLIDFILLLLVASFFKRKQALFYFIPVQILYPFYIVFVWIASLKGTFEWKGRKYNG